MSPRLLTCSLILSVFALLKGSTPIPPAQATEYQTNRSKWEYKVIKLDERQCSYENQIATSLNAAGEEGWELISYERLSILFPKDAEGTLLIRPAATGLGKEHTPQTADSFQGTMTLKMAQAQPGACRFLFKRMAPAAAKR